MNERKEKSTDRAKVGVLTALVGLILNITLAVGKLIAGIIARSVSVFSDAVNNFSDAGVSAVALFSFALSSKKADKEHPYGHGRSEYIANLIISIVVIFVAVELVRTSISRLITPTPYVFSIFALVVMCVSVLVKGAMTALYIIKNRKVRSDTLKASALDSASDCAVTTIITVCYIVGKSVTFPIDAVVGLLASALIAFSGIKIIIRTVGKLLGSADTGEVEKNVQSVLSSYPQVIGYHDLRVHDYGEEQKVASVDAEFDEQRTFLEVHSVACEIERKAFAQFGIDLVVHCDPVPTDDKQYLAVRREVVTALEEYGPDASFHELALSAGDKIVSLHLRLSERLMAEKERVVYNLVERVSLFLPGYDVKVEYDFM